MGLYNAEEYKVKREAEKLGLTLVLQSWTKLPPKFLKQTLRQFGKNPSVDEGSMYGKFWSGNIQRAGLHVHFSNEIEVEIQNIKRTVSGIIDIPKWVFGLDKIFEKEIKEARRVPGLYEMKSHGFEYRSLPADIDMIKVANVLVILQNKRWSSDLVLV